MRSGLRAPVSHLSGRTHAARAALESALAAKPCACGGADWHVTSTRGRVRLVKCRRCGRTGKVAVANARSPSGRG